MSILLVVRENRAELKAEGTNYAHACSALTLLDAAFSLLPHAFSLEPCAGSFFNALEAVFCLIPDWDASLIPSLIPADLDADR